MKLLIILLQVAFIVLKLTNVIQWHWLWVLSPMIAVNLFLLLVFAGAIYSIKQKEKSDKKILESFLNNDIKHESKFQQRMKEMMRKAKNNS